LKSTHSITRRAKLFIAVFIALIGLGANIAIEKYRTEKATQQFVLEKKLEALKNLKQAYDKMYSIYNNYTIVYYQNLVSDKNQINIDYNASIDEYMKIISNNSILYSESLRVFLDYVLWIHTACYYLNVMTTGEYRAFMNDIDIEFGIMCKKELGVVEKTEKDIFTFKSMTFKEVNSKDATFFLKENYKIWKKNNG
jgi:hypothetical protein